MLFLPLRPPDSATSSTSTIYTLPSAKDSALELFSGTGFHITSAVNEYFRSRYGGRGCGSSGYGINTVGASERAGVAIAQAVDDVSVTAVAVLVPAAAVMLSAA